MQRPENTSNSNPAAETLQSYVETLEEHFKKKKVLNDVIFDILDRQDNPLSFSLDLFLYSSQKISKKSKPGKLPITILESVKEWCKCKDVSQFLTRKQKIEALDKVLQFPNYNSIKLLCDIFHLEDDKDYMRPIISHLLSEQKFKVGFHLITALDLENDFALESYVFPLFFLGHETYVKSCLSKAPRLQPYFIRTLDSLCQDAFRLREFVARLNIESVKPKGMIIDSKWVQKRFPAFIDYFNIDIKECPNLYHTRVSKAMAYLFRRRFSEESIEYEPWEEMMLDTVKDHLDVQRALLVKLISFDEAAIAFRFAELLKMNKNHWPDAMKNLPYPLSRLPPINTRSVPDNYVDYLPLRLERSDIHLVDTPEKLIEAVDDISENYNMVGLDCEWKPSLGIFKEKAALCQLAVWDSVYLLDILALKEYQSNQIWEYLLRKIFYNEEITKLGYGGVNDLNVLIETIGCEKEGSQDYNNMVDLLLFFKKLKTHYPEIAGEIENWHAPIGEDQKGLSQLCKIVVGRPLDKAEQFSNWERRPLRERQIFYAALDAYCLLMIYEKLFPVLKKHELDIMKVLQTKQTPFKAQEPKPLDQKKPLPIKNFKLVVDNTIGGITKYLRLLGADVVALEEGDDHMRAVQIAQSQRRIIITAGAPFKKLSGYVPDDMCFCVDHSLTARQQVAKILQHYNVQCQDSDIFSRCTMCNESIYIHVQDNELLSLWTEFVGFEVDKLTIGRKNSTVFRCDVTAMDGHVHEKVPIQLAAFSPQVFEHVRVFFVCSGCGKVYWEGSHMSRLKKSMSKYVDVSSEGKSIYKRLLGELGSDDEDAAHTQETGTPSLSTV